MPLPALQPDSPLLRAPHSRHCRVAAHDPALAGATVAAWNGYAEPDDFEGVTP